MDIEEEITAIKQRNSKVEADKNWETSHTRKLCILIMTYVFILLLMIAIDIEKPYLAALVPTLAFFLSTLSLDIYKKVWLQYFYRS